MDCLDYLHFSTFDVLHLDADEYAALVTVCPATVVVVCEFASTYPVGAESGAVYVVGAEVGTAYPVGAESGASVS